MQIQRITSERLRERDLYEQDVLVFERKWPDGMEVTEGNFLRAAKLGIDIGSLASRILSPHALKAYERAIAPAKKAYEEALAQAMEALNEAIYPRGVGGPIGPAYTKAIQRATEACKKTTTRAEQAYEKAKARVLAAIIKGERGSA